MSEETERAKDIGEDVEVGEASMEIEPKPDDERPSSASSSASSIISRSTTPDQETELFERPQEGENEDPDQVAADISARGILKYKEKLSSKTAFRGMLMSACAGANTVEESDPKVSVEKQPQDIPSENKDNDSAENSQTLQKIEAQPPSSRPSSDASSADGVVDTGIPQGDNKEVSFQDNSGRKDRGQVYSPHLGEGHGGITSRPENSTVESVTVCTQTEWSWLQDLGLYQELMNKEPDWTERRRNISTDRLSAGKECMPGVSPGR